MYASKPNDTELRWWEGEKIRNFCKEVNFRGDFSSGELLSGEFFRGNSSAANFVEVNFL